MKMSAAVATALCRRFHRIAIRADGSTKRGGYSARGATIMNRIIDAIEKEQFKTDVTKFKIGDGIRVHTRVVEGDKERIQIFAGIVIGRKGRGLNETFTVRRISYGEGVERVFPLHSPRIAKVEVEKEGRARRAKLNYLRTRKGKEATAVRE
jgi:large subunit ribosomal protein L19